MSPTTDPFQREQPPLLIVISGPSGVGKDSVVQRMKERHSPFNFVVTATDRPPRPTEVHGRDYYFYSTAEFERMSEEELIARLRERRTETEEDLQERLETTRQEMSCIPEFDYVVVNRRDELDTAVDDVAAIIRAEHCRSIPRRIQL